TAGISASGRCREPYAIAGRPDDDHVADARCVRHVDPQVAQQLYASRTDEVAACLVAGEFGLVDDRYSRAAARQDEGRDAAGGTRSDDEHVAALVGHTRFLIPTGTVRCSDEEGPCRRPLSTRTALPRTCSGRSRVTTTCSRSCCPSDRTGAGGAR